MADAKNLSCLSCGSINRIPADKLGSGPKCGTCGDKLMSGKVQDVDGKTFETSAKRDGVPVVIDMWAPWCGPCRTMAPEFSKAAMEMKSEARFIKVNTDNNQKIAGRYNIRGIPALLLFKNGKEIARHAGVMRSAELVKWVRSRSM